MMASAGTLQLSHECGIHKNHRCSRQFRSWTASGKLHLLGTNISSLSLRQDSWSIRLSDKIHRSIYAVPHGCNTFKCHSFFNPGQTFQISSIKNAAVELTRSFSALQGKTVVLKLVPSVTIVLFAVWGLGPLLRLSRNIFLHKNDSSWKKSSANYVMTSYLQPLLLWTGATLICRALDPLVLPSEASEIVKQRLLNFVRSLSTVLAFAYCLSRVIQQTQKFFMETNDPANTRNMGFQFAGKAVYTAVWVAAVSLFMELLGFSTQKWLTAGGLGTVLLTLAGREIFTNFLSSVMIHATRPFVVNEWIQTKIEGYEVSGTVEHVGWWSPTIIRGEDREAVHIPNHKFTVNVVRNLTQKTHWRIKTHLAISHLDVNKINNIVADMRKVLAKSPQVEQQKLHRRVFLENVNPENQALTILISCFVKTSHFEEYLCVKEAILLDLLRVISHHRARLATPIRTVQKLYSDTDLDSMPFADSVFTRGRQAANHPLLLIEPSYKINGEDRTKSQTRSTRTNGEQDNKTVVRPISDNQVDAKSGPSDPKTKGRPTSDFNGREALLSNSKANYKVGDAPNPDTKKVNKVATTPVSDTKPSDKVVEKSMSKSTSKADSKFAEVSSSNSYVPVPDNVTENNSNKKQPKNDDLESARQSAVVGNPSSPSPDTKKVNKVATTPVSDAKPSDKVVEKSKSKSTSKADSKFAEVSSSNSYAPVPDNVTENNSNKQQPKNDGLESAQQSAVVGNPSSPSPETSGDKANTSTSTLKQAERLPETQSPTSRPVLEENIVLGVALDGSKRTLPIEEEMAPSATAPAVKEMATFRSGSGSPPADKDKKDSQSSNVSRSAPADQ